MSKTIVYYINQFFGKIGGEEKANIKPILKEEPIGPGLQLKNLMGDEVNIITVICGDSYFAENPEEASTKIIELFSIDGFSATYSEKRSNFISAVLYTLANAIHNCSLVIGRPCFLSIASRE